MKLENLFANLLQEPLESINDDTSPRNTKSWDSLKHLELVMAVEGAYSVQFTMAEIVGLNSVGRVRELLKMKGVAA
ncbi:MAG: acyl carrier protein [Kiloniellales bacterium]|nr:acyl carrier protein [Kiloniellales bacterium]